MKTSKPLAALGFYTDETGDLHLARVVSDGRTLSQVQALGPVESPKYLPALAAEPVDLVGIESAVGLESRVAVTDALRELDRPVVTQFRVNDLALGGQGRPLSAFYLHAWARWRGYDRPLVFVDLAAAATVVWVDPRRAAPEDPEALLAFESGPALGPLEQLLAQRKIAATARGAVADGALELFLDDSFFRRIPPKLMQPDSFALMLELVLELGDADAYATLSGMSATALLLAMEHLPVPPSEVFLIGRGHDHKRLVPMIRAALDMPVRGLDQVGGFPVNIEAQAMAFLAIRAAKGLPSTCPGSTGVHAAVGGGEILRP